ncbi:YfhO family protein [Blastococcus saxobsidens]|uniref:YfhO family protein n=1 Tax=Blastococcus saxobsidens TaxID=138336 RepID=UPI0002EAB821|nr:YfhO family protein [Blastococcus saxobsidens]
MPIAPVRETDRSHAALRPWASRLLTSAMVLSAVAFVVMTVGSSLVGSTSFYGGGELVNHKPWLAYGQEPIEVTNNTIGDTIDYFIPGRSDMVDRVRAGDWPGWNPLQGAGAALASVPSYGLLAPPGLAWWVLPHSLAPGWEKLTILVLATAGTALFLRRLGLTRHAAWLGGMVYAGSGFMIAWTNWPQAGVASMLPWLLWSVERALQLRTWRAQVPVALSVGALLLGGFPAVTGHGLYLAGGFALLRIATRRIDGAERLGAALVDGGRLLLAVGTGVLLAGVQLAHFVYTFLDLDTEYRSDSFNRLIPLRMALTALFPNVWGTRGGEGFYAGSGTNPIGANAYVGAAAAVLVAVALTVRPGRRVPRGARTYFALVVVGGVLLVYVQGPLLQWVGTLPIFAGNPIGRLVAVVLLAAAVLAGLGFDAVLRDSAAPGPGRRRALLGGMVAVLAVVGATGAWAYRQTAGPLDPAGQRVILAVAVAATVLTVAAVLVATFGPTWGKAALAVVPLAVAAQAVTAAQPMWAQVDREAFYPTTPVHEFLLDHQGSNRIAVTGGTMVSGPTAYYGLRTAPGHVFSKPEFNDLRRAACEPCLMTATNWVLPRETDLGIWQSPILDRMGAQYVTVDPDQQIPGRPEPVLVGDREVTVPRGDQPPLSVEIPGGPLRGVVLDFRSGPPVPSDGHLIARVLDENGRLLTETRRFVQYPRSPSPLSVPLVGESLPQGDEFTIELSWAGTGDAPRLAADAAGRPAVTVIRPEDDSLRMVHAEGAVIWERLEVIPRVHWASSAEVIASPADRIDAMAAGTLPADTVVLDRPGPPAEGGPATVEVLEDSGDRVSVRVDADSAGYLVLAESVQVDWTATVDGAEVDIVAADHAFGAVHVPAGRHDVTFTYTPRGATAGLIATGVGTALVVLALLLPTRMRRDAIRLRDPRRPGPRGGTA